MSAKKLAKKLWKSDDELFALAQRELSPAWWAM